MGWAVEVPRRPDDSGRADELPWTAAYRASANWHAPSAGCSLLQTTLTLKGSTK